MENKEYYYPILDQEKVENTQEEQKFPQNQIYPD